MSEPMTPEEIEKYGPPRDMVCRCGHPRSVHTFGGPCAICQCEEIDPDVRLFAKHPFQPLDKDAD